MYLLWALAAAAALTAEPRSAAIDEFEQRITSGSTDVADAFRSFVDARGGTPIIECPPGLKAECLVTFVWLGDNATRDVAVTGEAFTGNAEKHRLSRLAGTDVWYRTYRFRDDAAFMYLLSVNGKRKTDPLNRRDGSWAGLPRSGVERWLSADPGLRHGSVQRFVVPSAALRGDRTLHLYTSPDFQSTDRPTPLLVLFDGDEARDLMKVPLILDNLHASGRLPAVAAVFISQPFESREADLCCNSAMDAFVADELLPWVRRTLGIRTVPDKTVLAGASLGSLAATCGALRRPDASVRVLSQSGAFWFRKAGSDPWTLAARVSARRDLRFYLDVGAMETVGGTRSQRTTNRRLRETLRLRGYGVAWREFNGPHAYPCWRAQFGNALLGLLAD